MFNQQRFTNNVRSKTAARNNENCCGTLRSTDFNVFLRDIDNKGDRGQIVFSGSKYTEALFGGRTWISEGLGGWDGENIDSQSVNCRGLIYSNSWLHLCLFTLGTYQVRFVLECGGEFDLHVYVPFPGFRIPYSDVEIL